MTDNHKKKKKRFLNNKLIFVLIMFIVLLMTIFIGYIQVLERPEIQYYFQDSFHIGEGDWVGTDFQWVKESQEEQSDFIQLARKEYVAPNLKITIPLEQAPQESFVWHFSVSVTKFTEDAMTLGALVFPNGTFAVLINDEGELGISRDLFETPTYSKSVLSKISNNEWNEIYVYFDTKNKKLIIYANNHQVMVEDWEIETYPVQEIWLGAIWLKGAGNYGAPLQVKYDNIELANEGLVPTPSFIEYLKLKITGMFK